MARGGHGIVRRPADTQRQFAGRFTLRPAAELVAEIPDGHGGFVVTAGQFSFGDWAWAWLERLRLRGDGIQGHISRALVTVWALGADGVQKLTEIGEEIGGNEPVRLLIDPHQAGGSYRKHLDAFADRLGRDCIRLVSCHAKMIIFEGTDVVLASSANLTGAPRSEWMLAIRDQGLADTFGEFWAELFERLPAWNGEDKSLLPLRHQIDLVQAAAERLDMPAGVLVPATSAGAAPPAVPLPAVEPADVLPADLPELITGGSRGSLARIRWLLNRRLATGTKRTVGELGTAAKAERELIEAEALLGGSDVQLARDVLRAVEPALSARRYDERVRLARAGVQQVLDALR